MSVSSPAQSSIHDASALHGELVVQSWANGLRIIGYLPDYPIPDSLVYLWICVCNIKAVPKKNCKAKSCFFCNTSRHDLIKTMKFLSLHPIIYKILGGLGGRVFKFGFCSAEILKILNFILKVFNGISFSYNIKSCMMMQAGNLNNVH